MGLYQIKPVRLGSAIGRYCWIWETSEDKILSSPLITGAWRAQEVLGLYQIKPVRLGSAIGRYCWIWETSEDKILSSPLITGAWRAQVLWVD